MLKGIVYALTACFIWGFIFIIPQFMTDFSSVEVALGRYSFYGVISLCILLKSLLRGACRYPLSIWVKALYFSLISTFIYYTAVVVSLRYSNPAVCALILGISPITIAFYGNWRERECSFKDLIIPSVLIFFGLLTINFPYFASEGFNVGYSLGLLSSGIALMAWSWYAVANARFLKDNPDVSSNDWSTLVGVATLFWVVVCGLILMIGFEGVLQKHKYFTLDSSLINFLIGSAVLGIICSWLGAFLWNRASFYLPVSLAGQLTIFETLFGLLFVYSLAQQFPPQTECLGILILLGAVAYGIRLSNRIYSEPAIR